MDDNKLAPKTTGNNDRVYISTDAILDASAANSQTPSVELTSVQVDRQTTDGDRFPLSCAELVRLMDFTLTPTEKLIDVLASWGGVEGVCKKLNVDPNHGLNDRELDDPHNARKEKYGENMMPPLILPTLLEHAVAAVKDVTLLCLLGAATVSLAFGLYSDFTNEESEPNVHWVEGFAIFLAVFIIVAITAANNYKKDGLLRDQAAESDNIRTPVRRNGDSTDVPVHNILVGDVVLLKDGDIIPVDGLVIDSQSGKCDESSATGESDPIKKRRFDANSDCKLLGPNGQRTVSKIKGEVSEKATGTAGEGSNAKNTTVSNPATGQMAIDIEDGPIDFSPSRKKGQSSSVPFLVQSGTKVNEGTLTVVALAVGVHSRYGQLLKEVKKEVEDTPLQKLLARLAASIGWFGLGAALAQLVILTIKLIVKGVQGGWGSDIRWGPEGDTGSSGIVFAIINIIIQAVTIIVVAVPEGLPMAVTIALIYGTRKMAKRNNFVRQLAACETMGGATTICTDKTGTLTENRMTVVAGCIAEYVFDGTESAQLTAVLTDPRKDSSNLPGTAENRPPKSSCLNLFRCAIVRNSKAFITNDENGTPVFRGDKTESALLKLCITDMASVDLKTERTPVERIFPFSSKRKSMTSIAKAGDCAMNPDEKFHMYVKGAAEVILSSCSHYMDSTGTTKCYQNDTDSFEDMAKKKEVYQLLDYYAKQSLRCIVIAYLPLTEKDYQKMQADWEKVAAEGGEPQANYGNNLVFLGIVGIEDPLRNGVDVAVRRVQNAGIVVRMVTGDNIVTATSIAMKAGILANGGICMEGTDFRQMFEEHNAFHARLAVKDTENDDEQMPQSPAGAMTRRDNAYTSSSAVSHLRSNQEENITHTKVNASGWIDKVMKNDISSPDDGSEEAGPGSQSRYSIERGKASAFDKMLPKLRVLARSSPKDKQILVEHLKSLGETVAVTGDGANDGPALKAADVGFAMGIAGSGIAKEAASIILLDDNFCSVVTAVVWGRSISDSVRKFLMFQLTVNVTAVTVAVVSSIADDASSSVLTAVQLLWVNLLMDTFGALALATDEPDEEEYLSRPPMNNKRDPLITWNMRCMIIGQAIWQIVVTLTLLYAGHKLFLLQIDTDHDRLVIRTIVFNAFVLCNIFNEINCRRIDRVFNIFRKLHTNLIFIAIIFGTFLCQFFIVHFGGEAFKTTPIGGGHWAACIFIGLLTWPLGLFIRIVFFRVSPRAKAVKVDVYPTINPSWKRELLWKRAYRMALKQSRMSSNTNLGLSAIPAEEDTMTITLPIPVYNRLRNALENNTGSSENLALGSQEKLEEARGSNPGGLAPARSLNFPIFESVVAGIAARKAENST